MTTKSDLRRLSPVVAAAAGAAGALLVVAGWVGTSGRLTVAAQMPFVSLAVGGLVVAGAGAHLHVSATRERLAHRIGRFEQSCTDWLETRPS
jgi:hypothetical protein